MTFMDSNSLWQIIIHLDTNYSMQHNIFFKRYLLWSKKDHKTFFYKILQIKVKLIYLRDLVQMLKIEIFLEISQKS
jgi:hypothetical protein